MGDPPTATATFAANTKGGIVKINQYEMWRGRDISLSDEQVISSDILTDDRNAVFLLTTGEYLSALLPSEPRDPSDAETRLELTGDFPIEGTVASEKPTVQFAHTLTTYLPENSSVTLQLYSLTGAPLRTMWS